MDLAVAAMGRPARRNAAWPRQEVTMSGGNVDASAGRELWRLDNGIAAPRDGKTHAAATVGGQSRMVAGLVALTLGVLPPVLAYELDQVDVEAWIGNGANTVLLVVDFWPYNDDRDSFAFAYRFDDPQITGLQLLDAVQAAGVGFSYAAWTGGFVTDIWYVRGNTTYHTGYNWPQSYWSYWLSLDYGQMWDYSPVGAGQRFLQNGDTDGWLAVPGDDWTSTPVTPLAPPALPGDANGDGQVTFADIDPFIAALAGQLVYDELYPHGRFLNADCNGDGEVTFADIDPFVDLLQR